jgi:acyl-homoserine lactone acylase PvdQ
MGSTECRVPGLLGDVVIHRDEWGIPHASAASPHDAFFAQGYVQAEDRLGQLEYDRRRAAGRWAEVAGPTATGFDVFARRATWPAPPGASTGPSTRRAAACSTRTRPA